MLEFLQFFLLIRYNKLIPVKISRSKIKPIAYIIICIGLFYEIMIVSNIGNFLFFLLNIVEK